jgi:hypothetical protein
MGQFREDTAVRKFDQAETVAHQWEVAGSIPDEVNDFFFQFA